MNSYFGGNLKMEIWWSGFLSSQNMRKNKGKNLEKESEIQELSKTPLTLAPTAHRGVAGLPAAPSDPPTCFGASLKKHHGVG